MKKKLAKILTVLIVAILACSTMLIGCGSPSALEGTTWKVTEMSLSDGKKATSESLEALVGEITYEFKGEGLLVLSTGTSNIQYGTWSEEDNQVTFKIEEGADILGKIDGEALILENEGRKITFTKK